MMFAFADVSFVVRPVRGDGRETGVSGAEKYRNHYGHVLFFTSIYNRSLVIFHNYVMRDA